MAPPELRREHLEMVPEFRGEPELLPKFIRICDKLVARFYNFDNQEEFQNEQLMHSILSKIRGQAEIDISSSAPTTWDEIKVALKVAYHDKRDLRTLNIEIINTSQKFQETPFQFYQRVQKLLNLQLSYIQTNITGSSQPTLNGAKKALSEFVQTTAV